MLKLRPHHLLDIITDFGNERTFGPHPYGHNYHKVATEILAKPEQVIQLVLTADAVCDPCIHRQSDGTCVDILSQVTPAISKQNYNDDVDQRLFTFLKLKPGMSMNLKKLLKMVADNIQAVAEICTHPGEAEKARLKGLKSGLEKLEIL